MKYAITLVLLLTGCGLMETLDDTASAVIDTVEPDPVIKTHQIIIIDPPDEDTSAAETVGVPRGCTRDSVGALNCPDIKPPKPPLFSP